MTETELHDAEWVAERLGRSVRWVRSHIGEIPHHKQGGRYRFTEKNLDDYMRSTEVPPVDPLRPTRAPRSTRGKRS